MSRIDPTTGEILSDLATFKVQFVTAPFHHLEGALSAALRNLQRGPADVQSVTYLSHPETGEYTAAIHFTVRSE